MSDEAAVSIPKSSLAARLLRPKVAIPATLLALLLLSPWLIRGYYLAGVPDIGEPFDVEARLAVVVPDDENAFTDFHQAAALYIQPSDAVSNSRNDVNEHGWAWATPELEQFLHDNEAALLAWKSGAEKSRAQYHLARDVWMGSPHEVDSALREFARTVKTIGIKLETAGRPVEAWEWYEAAIRTSRLYGQNGGGADRDVGCVSFFIVALRLPVWSADPALDSKALIHALTQVQDVWHLTEKYSTVVEIEYLSLENTIRKLESHSDDCEWSIFASPSIPGSDNRFLLYIRGEPELTRRLLKFHTRNHLTFCDLPAWQRPPLAGISAMIYDDPGGLCHWSVAAYDAAFVKSMFAASVISPIHLYRLHIDLEEINYAYLQVVLAGQAFHRDHGRFPATLDELVPKYLTEIPVDPFDGQPIKYRLDPDGAVVYSVFENRIDEGGFVFDFSQIEILGSVYPGDVGLRLLPPARIRSSRSGRGE